MTIRRRVSGSEVTMASPISPLGTYSRAPVVPLVERPPPPPPPPVVRAPPPPPPPPPVPRLPVVRCWAGAVIAVKTQIDSAQISRLLRRDLITCQFVKILTAKSRAQTTRATRARTTAEATGCA